MKRELNEETKNKILKMASDILLMHGDIAGDRNCQDWSGSDEGSPESLFTKKELDDMAFNYELDNSGGNDYEAGNHRMGDEMVASFTIATAIKDMIEK